MNNDFNREMAKIHFEIYNKSPLIKRGGSFGLAEWIKCLSYNSTEEEKRMVKLFYKYIKQQCSKDEFFEVYDYMNNSIEDLMNSKLTKEDIKIAKEKMDELKKLSDEELSKKIEEEKNEDNYFNLSMIDAYVLHMIIKIDNLRTKIEFQKRLDLYDKENTAIAALSRVYSQSSKPCLVHPSIQNELYDNENNKNSYNQTLNGSKIYHKILAKSRT